MKQNRDIRYNHTDISNVIIECDFQTAPLQKFYPSPQSATPVLSSETGILSTYAHIQAATGSLLSLSVTSSMLCLLHDRQGLLSDGGCISHSSAFGIHLQKRLKMLGVDVSLIFPQKD